MSAFEKIMAEHGAVDRPPALRRGVAEDDAPSSSGAGDVSRAHPGSPRGAAREASRAGPRDDDGDANDPPADNPPRPPREETIAAARHELGSACAPSDTSWKHRTRRRRSGYATSGGTGRRRDTRRRRARRRRSARSTSPRLRTRPGARRSGRHGTLRGGDPFGASTAPLQGPAPLVTRESDKTRGCSVRGNIAAHGEVGLSRGSERRGMGRRPNASRRRRDDASQREIN